MKGLVQKLVQWPWLPWTLFRPVLCPETRLWMVQPLPFSSLLLALVVCLVMCLGLALVTMFPQIALWLPNQFYGN